MEENIGTGYDAQDIPFEVIAEGTQTALVCEPDAALRGRITSALEGMDYRITEAADTRDALKRARFHTYTLVVLNENFDTANPDSNDLLRYFSAQPMATRRLTFVALLSERCRTLDNMAAYTKSVDCVIHPKNADEFATVLKKALADSAAFYHIYKETLRKMGKL